MKPISVIFPVLLFLAASGPASSSDGIAVPDAFKKNIPLELRDGLKLVEVKPRCEDCSPWRFVDYRDNRMPEVLKQEKVSVQAGYTAMYAFPGTEYFANAKIEQSVPGHYENDRTVVISAMKHECARKKERITDYLQDNRAAREKVEPLLPKGKNFIDVEEATYKGMEYVSCTENVIGLMGATVSQLHIFVPANDMIITAYLLKQKNAKFKNISEFLEMRRDFIEGYIDFLMAPGAQR
jgi:hypothetical protein